MLQLFLSYAHEDSARVRQLCAELRRSDIEPWMDDELKLAVVWNDEIDERIKVCDFFVPLLSRATQEGGDDRFFHREWQLALAAKRPFLTICLEQCELPATVATNLKAEMKARQWAELFPSYEDGLRLLLRFLHEKKRTGVFEESFSCLGPDNTGWWLGGWQLDEADSTGENSRSLAAVARLNNTALLPQTVRQTATVTIELPARPLMLRYRRRLRLAAPLGGEASFRVAVDGEVVDSASHSDPAEDEWTTRSVPVPDRGARRAALELMVTASNNLDYFPSAEAWVDDLRMA